MLRRLLPLLFLAPIWIGCHPTTDVPDPPARPSGFTTALDRFVFLREGRIRFRETGVGQPVVLLHGYTDRLEMWTPIVDSLARDYRVIVPDIRGFGERTLVGRPGRYGRVMADDVIAMLDSLRIRRAHLVGYSMGALITTDLAVRHPSRVASAVLVAGPFYPDSAAMRRLLAPHLAALERGEGLRGFFRWILPTWSDSAIRSVEPEIMRDNDVAALITSLREMPGLVHGSDDLARIRVPAVAIVGRNDPLLGSTRWLGARWPGLETVELDDADHAVVFAHPAVTAAVRGLVRR